jgi:hypothetical protein
MYPEADDPNTVTTPAPNRGVAPAAPVQNRQPGFVVSLCSIAAGLVGARRITRPASLAALLE